MFSVACMKGYVHIQGTHNGYPNACAGEEKLLMKLD